jgi:hypothetical protein
VPGPWFRRNPTLARSLNAKRRERRLQADAALMAEHYPGLVLVQDGKGDAFVGQLTIGSASGINTSIDVRIDLPDRYPESEPVAVDIASRFPRNADAHIHQDGSCCLWLPWESPWDARSADGVITFIDHVVEFFFKQLVYEANGRKRWPGLARGHGTAGFQEFVCEVLAIDRTLLARFLSALADWPGTDKYQLCPCGQDKKLRWCHGPAVETLLRKVGRERLENRVRAWSVETLDEPSVSERPASPHSDTSDPQQETGKVECETAL